ncbi:MAG: sigma-70 family RNA polymerase sigma factor, partial [Anaerolineae bacterium]|nr:sigma-70 family RNA polymerase sigma factor [Anaerolineae bacterium]
MSMNQVHSSTTPAGEEDDLAQRLATKHIAEPEDLDPEFFPRLWNPSGGFIYEFIPAPAEKKPPEYVYVKIPTALGASDSAQISTLLAVSKWNLAWEAGHLRHEAFADELPPGLTWLDRFAEHNIYLVPRHPWHRYDAYAPMYHLLSHETLTRFGLPTLRRGVWPGYQYMSIVDAVLPRDVDTRLSEAFAHHVWPLLNPRSPISAFGSEDPIRILAHNLDYWLPHITGIIESRLRAFPRCAFDNDDQASLIRQVSEESPPDVEVNRPLVGGDIWAGEAEAWQATRDMLERADSAGQLRALVDAIRSNRVEDDFSDRWSYEREDFERKLYHKRSKLKVSFVELHDTIPVQGPESEVHEELVWEEFLALLDEKERRV